MVWGPEGVVARLGGPAVIIRGGSWRVCRECAAEVAVAARVCSRCGAPIVGQPPVVTDTVVADTVVADTVVADTVVADTVVAAISDAAGKAVPAGVAGQPPEPYVPDSGGRVPGKLRLVLAGYAGIACGLFAAALACAAAAVLVFFVDVNDLDDDPIGLLLFVLMVCICGLGLATFALEPLNAGNRFSRLLRRPSDPHTATVMASKRGGRTLILDIPRDGTGRGYQPLSEVRLALWMKAGMLVPGERGDGLWRAGR
jgi:hypothetical protein